MILVVILLIIFVGMVTLLSVMSMKKKSMEKLYITLQRKNARVGHELRSRGTDVRSGETSVSTLPLYKPPTTPALSHIVEEGGEQSPMYDNTTRPGLLHSA
jgi:hypothetical protein